MDNLTIGKVFAIIALTSTLTYCLTNLPGDKVKRGSSLYNHKYVRMGCNWVFVMDVDTQIGAFHWSDNYGNFGTSMITSIQDISDIPVAQ